ncbi:MAG: helix-turn-helix domain containing protein, partial [Desulfovibrio sp.]|nr:helix-turn-helix domain containing protein [Desulfovibrio sp.]
DGNAPIAAMPPEQYSVAEQGKQGRNAAYTRQLILVAARSLFAQNNYERVGTREIAARAGVNATLINRYFGSKKKLFTAVVNSLTELAKAPGTSVRDSLDQALDSIILAEEHTIWMEEFRIILFSALDPEVTDVISDFFEQKRQVLSERLGGAHMGPKTDVAYSLLMGSAVILTLLNRTTYPKENRQDLRNGIGLLLDQLLAAESPAQTR